MFCHSEHGLAWTQGLPIPHASHAHVWPDGVLVLFVAVNLNFDIALRNGSAYCMHSMSYQMLGTLFAHVLQPTIYSFLFLTFSSALWVVAVCLLSLSAYAFVHGQSLS